MKQLFKVKGTELHEAAKLIQKVLGKDPIQIGFRAKNNKLEIRAVENYVTVVIHVKLLDTVAEPIKFNCSVARLASICNKRGDLQFDLVDNRLAYKLINGKYSGELATEAYQQIEVVLPNNTDRVANSSLMNAYVKYIDIKSLTEKMIYLHATNMQSKNLHMAVADNFCIAFITVFEDTKLLDVMLPLGYQKSFNSWFKSYHLYKTENLYTVRANSCLLSLPVSQGDSYTVAACQNLITENFKNRTAEFNVRKHEVQQILENLESVYDQSALSLRLKDNTLYLAMESNFGKSSDGIIVEPIQAKNFTLNINYLMFEDCLSKVSTDTFTMFSVENRTLGFYVKAEKYECYYLITALN